MTEAPLLPGLVVRAQSGFFEVETARGVVTAQIRGRHRQKRLESDLLALGDRVVVQLIGEGRAVIEKIEPRERALSRRAPGGGVEQVLVANPDQAVFVFSCADPDPNFRMLDRMLVSAEEQKIRAVVCANKIDLVLLADARREFGEYQEIGYAVHYTSAKTGRGVSKLRKALRDKLSVLAGPSGAGKSSLLNAMQPGLGLRTGEISDATRRGIHTTVYPHLLVLDEGGYVADTPGLKAFALWDIEPEELDGYFPEFRALVSKCAFSDCTHTHEPECAIKRAVESGRISPERYESYLRIREGEETGW
jgi:ribosome biogenesis GTPase